MLSHFSVLARLRGFVGICVPGLFWLCLAGCGPADEHLSSPGSSHSVGRFSDSEGSVPISLRATQVGDGCEVNLFGDPGMKAVVMVFISTECPIANRYAPTLQQLADLYRPRDVKFWLVYADPFENEVVVREHLARYQYRIAAVRDPDHRVVEFCRVTKIPEAVVFGAGGERCYKGRIDDLFTDFGKRRAQPTSHDLRDALDAVLAGSPVAADEAPVIGCDIPDLSP